MSLLALRKGQRVQIGAIEFVILQRLPEDNWQLQNSATGEWCKFAEGDLLARFANNELSFIVPNGQSYPVKDSMCQKLMRDLAAYPAKLVSLAKTRVEYLKEIDRRQPIAMTQKAFEPVIHTVAERIKDLRPPSWLTVYRDYRKWITSSRDVRAIVLRYGNRGNRQSRVPPEVAKVVDEVIETLYMTPERKRVPEVFLEIVRRLHQENKFRHESDKLPTPSLRTIYREIARKSPYELTVARHGKRRADMDFRVTM
jgi:putative transposase